jgi:hypothetical protein
MTRPGFQGRPALPSQLSSRGSYFVLVSSGADPINFDFPQVSLTKA